MKEYICMICGYRHRGELPEDFRCPVCGAGKEAFREVSKDAPVKKTVKPKQRKNRELSAMEMSIICSNLARGCEKQYQQAESEKFRELAEFFRREAGSAPKSEGLQQICDLLEEELDRGYPYANSVSGEAADRGALRSLVWSEKVSRMLQSLLLRYQKEGDRMLEHTGVYLCTVCGFPYVGSAAPDLCPVCKVPSWKFEKLQGRESV